MFETISIALVLTVVTETLMGGFIGVMSRRFLICVIVINLLTNPALNLILYYIHSLPLYIIVALTLEVLVFFIEGLFYQKFLQKNQHPFKLSFILNVTSFLAGTIAYLVL